jgi:hypothetical protein
MFGKQMIALQTRKKALLLESDLNRLRLRAEVNNLREATNFSKHLSRFGSWGRVLAPLTSVVLALGVGRFGFAGGLLQKALIGVPALMRLWRTVSALFAEFRESRYS